MAAHRDQFDCQHCRWGRHCDERNPAPIAQWAISDIGLESHVCLLPMITDFSLLMWRLYQHYEKKVLPFAGGVMDQPNIYLESMEAIDSHRQKLMSER